MDINAHMKIQPFCFWPNTYWEIYNMGKRLFGKLDFQNTRIRILKMKNSIIFLGQFSKILLYSSKCTKYVLTLKYASKLFAHKSLTNRLSISSSDREHINIRKKIYTYRIRVRPCLVKRN